MPKSPAPERLRLKAEDEEDLTVLSTVLQDALVPVGDIAYLPDQRRLALVANRFCWECCPDEAAIRGDPLQQRVLTAFVIDHVTGVKSQGIDRKQRDHLLEVLAVQRVGDGGGNAIDILFSDDQALRVTVERIGAKLEDLEEPYPTAFRPKHRLDEGAQDT
ncbi:MAG: DUF2948 family protein [Alphaproteobacteria bacterium]|nr:DUF2948 family protein [Alphaproteobacteria bacterium]